MSYGPRLTPKQRIKLQQEIAAFDEKATLAEIERAAPGGKDIDAYGIWVKESAGRETVEANPDQLDSDAAHKWGQIPTTNTLGLSALERDAWELCKELGYTRQDAALELGVTANAVRTALARARQKLKGQL